MIMSRSVHSAKVCTILFTHVHTRFYTFILLDRHAQNQQADEDVAQT